MNPISERPRNPAVVIVDRTHMSRRQSGIERITQQLFSQEALAPLRLEGRSSSGGRLSMIGSQMVAMPIDALTRRHSLWVFPGYPPSPIFLALRDRTVLYVHDLFLMLRRDDLNRSARLYAAPLFIAAVRRLHYFFANSATTADQLRPHVRSDAEIRLYRPSVPNVFGLGGGGKPQSADPVLRVGALGTVEPRKNLIAGARICAALEEVLGRRVEFHVVGRSGWGGDFDALSRMPHVKLHGFLADAEVRAVIGTLDLVLCTSHDEGLGLPLLEVQYGGLPVVAPDQPVFREVLGESGCFIQPSDTRGAASAIAVLLGKEASLSRNADLASSNVERWNGLAARDRAEAIAWLGSLSDRVARGRRHSGPA